MIDFSAFHLKRDWENEAVTQIGRELAHTPWGAYESEEQARCCDREASRYTLSLDGIWRFRIYKNPDEVPDNFGGTDFDADGFVDIPVPSNWESHGFSPPIYTNYVYPFDTKAEPGLEITPYSNRSETIYAPPHVPQQDNPTGAYLHTFSLPNDFAGRECFLHFGGVESAFYLWINGQPVGYSQDSKIPADFCVTRFLRPGKNQIAVLVFKFSDGTYLEDQDYWHLSGIFRSVVLIAKPFQHIRDFSVSALPDRHGESATLMVRCETNERNGFADYSVRLRLYDTSGVLAGEISAPFATDTSMYPCKEHLPHPTPKRGWALLMMRLPAVRKWYADAPYLYTVTLALVAPDGTEVDFESARTGFRRIEIEDGVIKLNGQRMIFRGVDRHEYCFQSGRSVPRAHMEEEIKLMKRLNFNAVRTSHYPCDPIWYDLCDQYGMYVVCETNLETHGLGGYLANHPAWSAAFLERGIRNVLTHRNHPCIVSWSLGNESGLGSSHAAMANWIRSCDATRLVQYESGAPGADVSDIRCPMYMRPWDIETCLGDASDKRPLVQVEYAYQCGNSGGNFYKYWDLVEKQPSYQGGFIWDWQDKAFPLVKDGQTHWGIGGDFEGFTDFLNAGWMTANGVVAPDLTPKPAAYEIKHCQSPVKLVQDAPGVYTIRNRCDNLSSDAFTFSYTVLCDGTPIDAGEALPDEPVQPMSDGTVRMDASPFADLTGELFVTWTVRYRHETPFCNAGYILYENQFPLPAKSTRTLPVPHPAFLPSVVVRDEEDAIVFAGQGFTLRLCRESGLITSFSRNGKIIWFGGENRFFRPATAIDYGTNHAPYGILSDWLHCGYDRLQRTLDSITVATMSDGSAFAEVVSREQADAAAQWIEIRTRYTVHPDGSIDTDILFDIDTSLRHLPRVGVGFTLSPSLEEMSFYGRGPQESYADRKKGALMGVYTSRVAQQDFPFLPPCECGGHEDVRWVRFFGDGVCVSFEAKGTFHFDAHHSTIQDIYQATHPYKLRRRDEIFVNLDCTHAGLGGDDGWSQNLHDEFRVRPGIYHLAFTIRTAID